MHEELIKIKSKLYINIYLLNATSYKLCFYYELIKYNILTRIAAWTVQRKRLEEYTRSRCAQEEGREFSTFHGMAVPKET